MATTSGVACRSPLKGIRLTPASIRSSSTRLLVERRDPLNRCHPVESIPPCGLDALNRASHAQDLSHLALPTRPIDQKDVVGAAPDGRSEPSAIVLPRGSLSAYSLCIGCSQALQPMPKTLRNSQSSLPLRHSRPVVLPADDQIAARPCARPLPLAHVRLEGTGERVPLDPICSARPLDRAVRKRVLSPADLQPELIGEHAEEEGNPSLVHGLKKEACRVVARTSGAEYEGTRETVRGGTGTIFARAPATLSASPPVTSYE